MIAEIPLKVKPFNNCLQIFIFLPKKHPTRWTVMSGLCFYIMILSFIFQISFFILSSDVLINDSIWRFTKLFAVNTHPYFIWKSMFAAASSAAGSSSILNQRTLLLSKDSQPSPQSLHPTVSPWKAFLQFSEALY